ncbi:MAG: hypothetical protein ABI467_06880 [Kofleriaceae bacterium]
MAYSGVLARTHLSIGGTRRKLMSQPDASLLQDVVTPKVLDALKRASEALVVAGVRHVVIGGLAVGANGYARNTKDVDFLVGAEAFEHHPGGLVTLRAGVPFQVNGVAIDFLSPDADEAFLEAALASPPGSMIDAGPLIYLKLKASRLKDQADVVELVKASLDVDACRAYLQAHAQDLVARFDALVERAATE